MIRKIVTAAALLVVAACSKAPQDMTAHYSVGGGRGTMTVRAAANGDAKFEAGPQTLLHKDGVDYLVVNDPTDRFAIKLDDFVGAMADMAKEQGKKPQPLPNNPEYEAVNVGEEKVADQKGDIWTIRPKGGANGETVRVVIAQDSTYAPIGKAFGLQTRFANARSQMMFTGVSNADKTLGSVLDKGMVLSLGDSLTLQDVAKGPIAASEFALPKVLDRAAFRKRIAEQAAKAAAEAAKGAPAGGAMGDAPAAPVAPSPAPASPAPAAPAGK